MTVVAKHGSRKTLRTKRRSGGSPSSRLRAERDLLKRILDHVADPIFVKDRQHRIIYGNQALSEMIGLPPSQYLGKDDFTFFPKDEADVFWEKDDHVFETGEVDLNEEHLTDSRGRLHIISTKKSRCITAGRAPVIVGITRDVTAFKEIERLKNEFVAMISHELRTPLTSIHASLELLASGEVSDLSPETAIMIKIAHTNSERLVRLVSEILDIEKIEVGMLNPQIEVVPVAQFLAQAINENAAYGKKYGVTYTLGAMPADYHVQADAGRLMQVLANLLSNAAKFSRTGSIVMVSAMPASDGYVRLEVRDDGIGIAEKFHSKIFEKFSQGDSSITRQQGGTGLGLNISKKLVEAMGGTISFESQVGRGSSFYVDLPLAPAKVTNKKAVRKRAAAH